MKAGKIVIVAEEWFQEIKNGYPPLEAEYLRLEPEKSGMVKTKTETFASVRTRWLNIVNSIRTKFFKENRYVYIPEITPQCRSLYLSFVKI